MKLNFIFSLHPLFLKIWTNICSVEICEDIVQILQESDTPNPAFRLWITTEVNKVNYKCFIYDSSLFLWWNIRYRSLTGPIAFYLWLEKYWSFTREDPLHSEGLYNRRKIRRYYRNQWRVFDSVINCAIALPNNYY